eukprot:Clim_evm6s53 gene=Clim_evmTU6s53
MATDRSKTAVVVNRAAAEEQITAEQLIKQSQELIRKQDGHKGAQPNTRGHVQQKIMDQEELAEYRILKRKEFEERVSRIRSSTSAWVKYAKWEEIQKDFRRARSVFERALEIHTHDPRLWLHYAEMEMRNEFVNHARNLLDRATTLLPRADQLWSKYVYMEELLGNVVGCRAIYERWMKWDPPDTAWFSFIRFELRYGEVQSAREIYERFVIVHPKPLNWIRWARFEEDNGEYGIVRKVMRRAVEYFGEDNPQEELLLAFARFEERVGEKERARGIYQYAIKTLEKGLDEESKDGDDSMDIAIDDDDEFDIRHHRKPSHIYRSYLRFEKKYGSATELNLATIDRRRKEYEALVREDSNDYAVWHDYAMLERQVLLDVERMRKINLEELKKQGIDGDGDPESTLRTEYNQNVDRALRSIRRIYDRALTNVPLADTEKSDAWRDYVALWLDYATFEETESADIDPGRQNEALDHAESIYVNLLEVIPHKNFTFAKAWLSFAGFKVRRHDLAGARKLLGRAIGTCPTPKIFAGYIDMELKLLQVDRCRKLYEKFVGYDPTSALVWVQYAELEAELFDVDRVRAIYELALAMPVLDQPELVWKAYLQFEMEQGTRDYVDALYKRLLDRTSMICATVWISYIEWQSASDEVVTGKMHRVLHDRAEKIMLDALQKAVEQSGVPMSDKVLTLFDGVQDLLRHRERYETSEEEVSAIRRRRPTLKVEEDDATGTDIVVGVTIPELPAPPTAGASTDDGETPQQRLLRKAKEFKRQKEQNKALQEQ